MSLMESPRTRSARVSSRQSYYDGMRAVLATMHGKEKALQKVFALHLGMTLVVPSRLNTDRLGTFSGEVKRPYRMRKTAQKKVEMGMMETGCAIGLATEGSFGPDPLAPGVSIHTELVVFRDNNLGIEIAESLKTHDTNHGSLACTGQDDITPFLDEVGFPGSALAVKPEKRRWTNQWFSKAKPVKGIQNHAELQKAIRSCCRRSKTGRAVVETDMRAHVNPARMELIAKVGEKIASRLKQHCPDCGLPGWGITLRKQGLKCGQCEFPTEEPVTEIWSCSSCHHTEEKPRRDGVRFADPARCAFCNP